MAYDEELAERVRELLGGDPTVFERAMFGGLAFLAGGKMALAVSGQGGLLVRAGAEAADRLVAAGAAQPAVMGDRRMRGWVRLVPGQLRTRRQLARWVRQGMEQARSLGEPARGRTSPGAPRLA